jgi:hypothetical protein
MITIEIDLESSTIEFETNNPELACLLCGKFCSIENRIKCTINWCG